MKLFKYLIVITLFALTSSAFAMHHKAPNNKESIIPEFQSPSKPIMIKPETKQFEIRLASNLSTGYSWFLTKYNPRYVKPISHMYVKPQGNKPGQPGQEVWVFKVEPHALAVPQVSKLTFVLIRPWEKNKRNPKKAKFTLVFAGGKMTESKAAT